MQTAKALPLEIAQLNTKEGSEILNLRYYMGLNLITIQTNSQMIFQSVNIQV